MYFGPPGHETDTYWTVEVSDAKRPIQINGTVGHALRAYAGVTIGCALSNTAIDKANAALIGHPVYLAEVTPRTAYLVDRLGKDGQPVHAIRYSHSYRNITDMNDKRTLPSWSDRSFSDRQNGAQRPGRHLVRLRKKPSIQLIVARPLSTEAC